MSIPPVYAQTICSLSVLPPKLCASFLISGIASVGLAAAYYSSGTQTEFTQSVNQFASFHQHNAPYLLTALASHAVFPFAAFVLWTTQTASCGSFST